MKKFKIFIFISLINVFCFAQVPIQWQKTIGASQINRLTCMGRTIDGGCISGGYSNSNISGDKTQNCKGSIDYWVVKTDLNGNIQWDKTIGGSGGDMPNAVIQTTDKGYIVGGQSDSPVSGDKTQNGYNVDYWLVKLDSNGNKLWDKTIIGGYNDYFQCLQLTADRGFIVGGYSTSNAAGDKTQGCRGLYDYWIVKLDSVGNIQWDKTLGGSGQDDLYFLQQTSDGGYICGGGSDSPISGEKTQNSYNGAGSFDYWVVKLDALGNTQWDKTIGGSGYDYITCLLQTTDSGYLLCGNSNSSISFDKTQNGKGGLDYWLVKLNNSGVIQWTKTIGGNGDDQPIVLLQANDGGYFIGGTSGSDISSDKTENRRGTFGYEDFWLVKTDVNGNVKWDKTIGGDGIDEMFGMCITTDGGLIVGGPSNSNISGEKSQNSIGLRDYWIVKYSSLIGIEENSETSNGLNAYPNPSNGLVNFVFTAPTTNANIKITDLTGQTILQKANFEGYKFTIDISEQASGMYFLEFTEAGKISRIKLVKS